MYNNNNSNNKFTWGDFCHNIVNNKDTLMIIILIKF